MRMLINSAVFYIFAILSVISAILTVSVSNPVKSAVSMIFCLFCLAVIYFTLGAHFAGIIQILVYAGAIMVLFLFVIMLLEKRNNESFEDIISAPKIISLVLAVILLTALSAALAASTGHPGVFPNAAESFGTLKAVGSSIFKKYIFVFEALSALILVAIAGVTLLSAKNSEGDNK